MEQGIVGAQSKGQFHDLYGPNGTQTLFAGMATQVVFGGCDFETAEFYSKASGVTTADSNTNPDQSRANFRQRPLLTPDEIITPLDGNCTIFARYVEPAYATQVVLTAQLTRLYERSDWKARLVATQHEQPLVLARPVPLISEPRAVPALAAPAAAPERQRPTETVGDQPDTASAPKASRSVLARLAGPQLLAAPTLFAGEAANPNPGPVTPDPLDASVDRVMNKAAGKGISPDKYQAAQRAKQGKRTKR